MTRTNSWVESGCRGVCHLVLHLVVVLAGRQLRVNLAVVEVPVRGRVHPAHFADPRSGLAPS